MSKISTTYDGIEIEYIEDRNSWRFELRGRERTAPSLEKAKELIDKPAPQEKNFTPVKAYFAGGYTGEFKESTITSLAVKTYGGHQVWHNPGGAGRRKDSLSEFYELSSENAALIAELKDLEKQSDAIDATAKEARRRMKKLKIEGAA